MALWVLDYHSQGLPPLAMFARNVWRSPTYGRPAFPTQPRKLDICLGKEETSSMIECPHTLEECSPLPLHSCFLSSPVFNFIVRCFHLPYGWPTALFLLLIKLSETQKAECCCYCFGKKAVHYFVFFGCHLRSNCFLEELQAWSTDMSATAFLRMCISLIKYLE